MASHFGGIKLLGLEILRRAGREGPREGRVGTGRQQQHRGQDNGTIIPPRKLTSPPLLNPGAPDNPLAARRTLTIVHCTSSMYVYKCHRTCTSSNLSRALLLFLTDTRPSQLASFLLSCYTSLNFLFSAKTFSQHFFCFASSLY